MFDMTICLQAGIGKCLYEQIYEYIKQDICEGKLLTGERLPSTRSLAEYLQVARSTVDYAYEQLISEGYIESRPYRGYFVCSLEDIISLDGNVELKKEITEEIPTYEEDHIKEAGNYKYDFSPYAVDMSLFPFEIWKRINKNILNYGNWELFSQGAPQGDYDLRETIARYLHSSRGVNCSPNQIIIGAGTDYLLMLLEKILGRHVKIAMENPTYAKAYKIFKSFAYDITTIDLLSEGLDIGKLKDSDVRGVYVMPSHQFPTGAVMTAGKRNELLKWASKEEGRFIIEDDYDSEFRYKGKPIPSLQSTDQHGKVIYMGTFSKAIAPAIRVSYMVLPDNMLKRYKKECSFYSCTVSRIDQKILNEFIRDGYFERYLNRMRKKYRAKHEILLEGLKGLSHDFIISGENAGLHILLTARNDVSEEELVKKAAQHNIKVYGMSDSLVVPHQGKATILLGFGGMPEEDIAIATDKLCKAFL